MPTKQESWSGGRQAPQVRHRWQSDWTELQNSQFLAPPRRLRRTIIGLFLLLLALFAAFVYVLLYTPEKTPFVMVTATAYEWPAPVNAWAQEDADGFAALDARNLRVLDMSAAWQTKERGLSELQQQLDQLGAAHKPADSVVLYLSMHGAVNAAGEPCLIPPGIAPLQSQQWLPVRQLLAMLDERLAGDTKKLLILDSNRLDIEWRLGILHNTFVDRLGELLAQQPVPNLAVLTAASDGEVAWGSRDLQGSIFGKHVRLGLAGAADLTGYGNGDGRITLHELHRYVRSQTQAWAHVNRAATQTPRLLPATAPDNSVTWAINRRSLAALIETAAAAGTPNDAVASEDIAKLWQEFEQMRDNELLAYDPLGVHRLEHQLLELEARASGGRGYAKSAEQLLHDLQRQFARIAQRRRELSGSQSGVAIAELISGDQHRVVYADSLHSLATCEYFSGLPAPAVREFRERLLQLAADPREEQLDALLNEFSEKDVFADLCETRLLRMACRYNVDQLWSTGNPVATVVNARVVAEQLAGLGDPRARRLVRAGLSRLDTLLRSAEDTLFAGEAAASTTFEQLGVALEELQSATDSPLLLAAQALQTSDRAVAELPYLARWFCRPLPSSVSRASQNEADDFITGPLLQAIIAAATLGEVTAGTSAAVDEPLPFVDGTHAVQDAMTALRDALERDLQRLLDPLNQDVETLREIEELLRLPQIPWPQRLAILQKRDVLQSRLSTTSGGQPDSSLANEDGRADSPAAKITYAERSAGWNRHPLLAILQLDTVRQDEAPGNNEHRSVARVGEDVRRRLMELVPPGHPEGSASQPRTQSSRDELTRRSHAARASAPFWLPDAAGDPIADLRRFDWQESLLHQTRRSLDDFWGPVQSPGVTGQPLPFFELAASNYLDAAAAIMPLRGELEQRAASLQRELSRRRVAARRGLQVTAETDIQLEANDAVAVEVAVTGGLESELDTGASPVFSGLATLFVRSPQGPVAGARSTIPLPVSPDDERRHLSGMPAGGAGRAYEAVALFRGHEFAAPFLMEGLGGIRVDYQPQPRKPTQVTVFGDRRRRSSIVFVLDCSSSMGQLISVEAIGANELPRLELAKSALSALLGELEQRTDTRVGVRFYGHRIGWTKTEPVQALAQTDYAGEIPDDLSPSEDVELVLPLGRFDSVEAGKVIRRMESLKPWGQSPSYLALLRCLDDFETEDRDTDRSVVVITDGLNYQFTPTNNPQGTAAPTTRQDVLTAWEGRDIPVYILGFGIAADESRQAEEEYREIAQQTGGAYYPVNNGRDLLRTLRDRLSLGGYSVTDSRGRTVSPHTVDQPLVKLNTPVQLPELDDPSATYTVNFESLTKTIEVEGGESIELYVSGNGTDLLAKPFDEGFPVAGVLVRPGAAERFILRAHRPRPHESDITFPLSIQSETSYVTPRPADVWVEITPVVGDDAPRQAVYGFYDSDFEFGQPVPVVNWTATNWPVAAEAAAIRVWAKFTPTEPVQTIAVADLLKNRSLYSELRSVNGVSGVRFRIDISNGEQELKVIEQHDDNSSGVYSINVKFDAGRRLQPTRVVHRYDAENRLAIHSYFFPPEALANAAGLGVGKIEFYSRESLQSGAWTIEGGSLAVPIFGTGDTLPLNAATGRR